MTIVELAEKTGFDRNSIASWERGEKVPRDRGRLTELAEALGLDPNAERDFAAAAGEFRLHNTKRRGQTKPVSSTATKNGVLIYGSKTETQPFSSWLLVSEGGRYSEKIRFFNRPEDGLWTIEVKSFGNEVVGTNRAVGTILGRVEFDYKAEASDTTNNLVLYAIPRKEIWMGRIEIIEPTPQREGVHHLRQSYRAEYIIPMNDIGDGKWHHAVLPFDFRNIPGVVYTVVAPRINEGCKERAFGHLLVSNIQVLV